MFPAEHPLGLFKPSGNSELWAKLMIVRGELSMWAASRCMAPLKASSRTAQIREGLERISGWLRQ
jgi:hypothetical protein